MCFSFEICTKFVFLLLLWYTIVFLLFVSKAISTQISINLLDYSRFHIGLLSDILTWSLFWEPKELRKAHWKFVGLIYQQILVVYYKCILVRWKCVFFSTAPIHIVWSIRNILDCLEDSKCVFIWNMIYFRVPPICFKSYLHPNFY
jgi:hypothetical protein